MLAAALEFLAEIGKFVFEFFKEDTMSGDGWTLQGLTGWYARRKYERKQMPRPERRVYSDEPPRSAGL